MTIREFIKQYHISMTSEYTSNNPNMANDQWSQNANHFKVTLVRRANGKRYQMTTYFSMGSGLHGDPQIADVLDCLASDASSVDNARDFEDWAGDFGYDADSRKAERTYKICLRQARRLQHFMRDLYFDLLDTERL